MYKQVNLNSFSLLLQGLLLLVPSYLDMLPSLIMVDRAIATLAAPTTDEELFVCEIRDGTGQTGEEDEEQVYFQGTDLNCEEVLVRDRLLVVDGTLVIVVQVLVGFTHVREILQGLIQFYFVFHAFEAVRVPLPRQLQVGLAHLVRVRVLRYA